MKLVSIIDLYHEMKTADQLRQQFTFEYNGVVADVMFFIDSSPFELLFGILTTQESFSIAVNEGFIVPNYFDNNLYMQIVRIFKIQNSPGHTFGPSDFWNAFSPQVPHHVKATRPVTPKDIATYKKDIEESDRLYFCGFIDQSKTGHNVRNLEKTRTLMGEQAYQICKRKRISTKWTDKASADKYSHWKEMIKRY